MPMVVVFGIVLIVVLIITVLLVVVRSTSKRNGIRQGANNNVFCTNCGTKIEDGSQFCSNCGQAVQTDENANAAPVTMAPVQPAIPVQENNVFCTNCGTQIGEDTLFCTKCGAKVGTGSFEKQRILQAGLSKIKKNPLAAILAAAGVAVVLVIIIAVSSNNRPAQPSYTSGTGTVSPPPSTSVPPSNGTATAPTPSAPTPPSGGTATAPAPSASAPPTGGTATQSQSPAPAQSSKAVNLWHTGNIREAKSEIYKLCDRFKYYETETYGKSRFVKEWGNNWEWIYDVDSPDIQAIEIDGEVYVFGFDKSSAETLIFSNSQGDFSKDTRDRGSIDIFLW